MIMLTKESSTILRKKLPPKLKDPRSFIIYFTIVNSYFEKSLYNLGASIYLIPFLAFRKLGFREVNPITISLQLAYRFIKYLRAIIKDVLVKVDKFSFQIDFKKLDMEENEEDH